MPDRILELAETAASLRIDNGLLVVGRRGQPEASFPPDDLAVLVVAHPEVTYTQAVVASLAAAGGVLVHCDRARLPVALTLPLTGHHVQGERMRQQAAISLPTSKRLWKQVVQAKIAGQQAVLEQLGRGPALLEGYRTRVRSGDPENVEAQAARRYWGLLFADPAFRRDHDGGAQNAALNYGYAVLRAVVARAVCAAGLHPGLGLHHHNRYDPHALASDLMEVLRPLVDLLVARDPTPSPPGDDLNQDQRRYLLQGLLGRVVMEGERRTLFDASARMATSLVKVVQGDAEALLLPDVGVTLSAPDSTGTAP